MAEQERKVSDSERLVDQFSMLNEQVLEGMRNTISEANRQAAQEDRCFNTQAPLKRAIYEQNDLLRQINLFSTFNLFLNMDKTSFRKTKDVAAAMIDLHDAHFKKNIRDLEAVHDLLARDKELPLTQSAYHCPEGYDFILCEKTQDVVLAVPKGSDSLLRHDCVLFDLLHERVQFFKVQDPNCFLSSELTVNQRWFLYLVETIIMVDTFRESGPNQVRISIIKGGEVKSSLMNFELMVIDNCTIAADLRYVAVVGGIF